MKNKYFKNRLSSSKTHRSGAALIITLLMVAAVSGITFFASRLAIREIIIMSKFEDSMKAYYIAEAGIEQGLLMRKENPDVELSAECTAKNCQNKPTNTTGTPVAITVDTNSKYDLKIWHRVVGTESSCLKKDEASEYDISGLGTITLSIDSMTGNDYFEYFVIDSSNNIDYANKDLLCSLSNPGTNCSHKLSANISSGAGKKLRLHYYNSTLDSASQVCYHISAGAQTPIDSRTHIIESTGTYANNKRKIRVEIDRNSGKIMSIFDFVLFGNKEIINP